MRFNDPTKWKTKLVIIMARFNIPEKFNFVDKLLLSTLAVLLMLLAIQILMVLFGLNKVHAQEQTSPTLKTVSFGQKQQSFNEQDKQNFIEQSRTQEFSDQNIGKASSMTRAQRLELTHLNKNTLASKSMTLATV